MNTISNTTISAKEIKSLIGKQVRVTMGLEGQEVDEKFVHEGELFWHKRNKRTKMDVIQLTKVSMGMYIGSFQIEEI
jgi:hypothetical protein